MAGNLLRVTVQALGLVRLLLTAWVWLDREFLLPQAAFPVVAMELQALAWDSPSFIQSTSWQTSVSLARGRVLSVPGK